MTDALPIISMATVDGVRTRKVDLSKIDLERLIGVNRLASIATLYPDELWKGVCNHFVEIVRLVRLVIASVRDVIFLIGTTRLGHMQYMPFARLLKEN
ncbi:hypothetical protein GGR33_003990 [Methylobacterium brachythecii]|nr:hypothetical protein [Methylobacterium brachythecii]MBB3904471.1 hypothetical protein [Methylobacterium brachythecii]